MNTRAIEESGPLPGGMDRRTRRRSGANRFAQGEILAPLAMWLHQWPDFVPGPWAARQLGITRAAVNMGVRRGLVRASRFRLRDGTVVQLVSVFDVSRIAPRRSLPADIRARLAPIARVPKQRQPKAAKRGTGVRQAKAARRSIRA